MKLEKVAHDISIALLPKSIEALRTNLFPHDEESRDVSINSLEIVDTYYDLYNEVLEELKSRQ